MITIKIISQSNTSKLIWADYTNQIDRFDWGGAHFLAKKMRNEFFVNERVILAFDDDDVIGMGALTQKDISEIPEVHFFSTLYVLPNYRKIGVAKKIVLSALSEASSLKWKTIYVQTQLNMFYEKLGFTFQRHIVDFSNRKIKLYSMNI